MSISITITEKVQKKYGELNGSVFMVELIKGPAGLGISLAGNRDRTKMSVFICGLHPKGSGAKDGRIQVGDEILEVIFMKKCLYFIALSICSYQSYMVSSI